MDIGLYCSKYWYSEISIFMSSVFWNQHCKQFVELIQHIGVLHSPWLRRISRRLNIGRQIRDYKHYEHNTLKESNCCNTSRYILMTLRWYVWRILWILSLSTCSAQTPYSSTFHTRDIELAWITTQPWQSFEQLTVAWYNKEGSIGTNEGNVRLVQ